MGTKRRDLPKENEKSEDDVVFPLVKEMLLLKRRCAGIREYKSAASLNG
jgi:hypothetical protein